MRDVEPQQVGSVMIYSYLDNWICLKANLLDCGNWIGGRLGWRRWWRGSNELLLGNEIG